MNAVNITIQIIGEEYPILLLARSPPGGKLPAHYMALSAKKINSKIHFSK